MVCSQRVLPEYNEIIVSTSTHHVEWQQRLEWTLRSRALVLLLEDDAGVRAAVIHDLHHRYQQRRDYTPELVTVPERGTDAAFMRRIAAAVGLTPQRSRYHLFREFEAYCSRQYAADKRVLLLIDDAHHLRLTTMRVLHSLSTIVVANDLAVGMVMVGRGELVKQLQQVRWRAFESRIGLRVRLPARETKAA